LGGTPCGSGNSVPGGLAETVESCFGGSFSADLSFPSALVSLSSLLDSSLMVGLKSGLTPSMHIWLLKDIWSNGGLPSKGGLFSNGGRPSNGGRTSKCGRQSKGGLPSKGGLF